MPIAHITYEDASGLPSEVSPTTPLPVTNIGQSYSTTGDTLVVSGATSDITNTAATTVIAGAASVKLHITHLIIQNSHATVGTWVNVTEETSGTVLYTVYCAAVGGGASITFPTPLIVPTNAKALQVTPVTTGANIRASASGYKA